MLKSKLLKITFLSLPVLGTGIVVTSTSCSKSDELPLSTVVNLLYGGIKITPNEHGKTYHATKENYPAENIVSTYFNGLPESMYGIEVKVEKDPIYNPGKGEMTVTFKFIRGHEFVERDYLISGLAIEFEDLIDKIYGDVKIYLRGDGSNESLPASPEIWHESMITPQYFEGLPVNNSSEGITVTLKNFICNEKECSMDVKYLFSKGEDQMTTRTYTITGFGVPKYIENDVNELYGNIEITPTNKAKKLAATEANWPISNITSTYFNGLPVSKNEINVKVISVECIPDDGVLFIQFEFSKNGFKSAQRTVTVEGFARV